MFKMVIDLYCDIQLNTYDDFPVWERGSLEGDSSVMTYYGHSVRKTLIRCRFSPPDNTGQRFICTGDSTGRFISKFQMLHFASQYTKL